MFEALKNETKTTKGLNLLQKFEVYYYQQYSERKFCRTVDEELEISEDTSVKWSKVSVQFILLKVYIKCCLQLVITSLI